MSQSQKQSVERYIADQERHHHARPFEEEFLEMLRVHEIEYDERYVFD